LVCRPLSYPDTDVLLVCFSVANADSLTNVVDKWLPEVSHFCPGVPVVLVGTKKDLRTEPDAAAASRCASAETPVSTEQGQRVAALSRVHAYVECSARTREGVEKVFETAALAALRGHRPRSAWRSKCRIL